MMVPKAAAIHQLLCRSLVENVFNEGKLDLLDMLLTPDAIDHGLEGFDLSGGSAPPRSTVSCAPSASPFPICALR